MASVRILIVEDELIVAKNMQNKLKRLGYDVPTLASSGDEAIKKAEQMRPRPNLVLMDIKLKGDIDGVEAAKQIRDRFNIPVIYLTGYSDEKTLQRAKKTAPFGYVLKPIEARELHATIEIALYKHRMEKQLKSGKQWFANTIKSIGDAVIATDANGSIKFMNPVSEKLTGWKQKEVFGKRLTEVFNLINEETREVIEEPATKAMQEGIVVGLEEHTLLIAKDGTERLIGDSGAPIIDDKGKISGAVLVFHDITKRTQAKEGQTRLNKTAKKEINDLRQRFSHGSKTDSRPLGFENIIGQSKIICNIFMKINQIAKTDSNVLIFGETGTGKELIARTIHSHSLRKDADFIPVDCAAIPANLLESELFGFEKGAFTGAVDRKFGLLEFANQGTLFLDEISALDVNLQVKLLRVLQERQFRRIGGKQLIDVDMRVIAAMNKNPRNAISEGRLRKDLFYRLNVIPIHIPSLRQRRDDIPLLVNHFLKQTIKRSNLDCKEIAPEAMEFLVDYRWPGNVRQLENIIERLVLLSQGSVINVEDLPTYIKSKEKYGSDSILAKPFDKAKKKHLEKFEKNYFRKLLKDTNYNIAEAAKISGISTRTIYRIIKRYGKL
ncbi:MAG: sigma 54-interacting transcriptional regulator [bacterium]